MLIKLYDMLGRIPLLLAALVLTHKAKLRAAAWALRWIAKKAIHQPITLEQVSELGTVSLKVTNSSAQLLWTLPPEDDCTVPCRHQCNDTPTLKQESSQA